MKNLSPNRIDWCPLRVRISSPLFFYVGTCLLPDKVKKKIYNKLDMKFVRYETISPNLV